MPLANADSSFLCRLSVRFGAWRKRLFRSVDEGETLNGSEQLLVFDADIIEIADPALLVRADEQKEPEGHFDARCQFEYLANVSKCTDCSIGQAIDGLFELQRQRFLYSRVEHVIGFSTASILEGSTP